MSKMQAAKQLPMPAAGSASELPMPAAGSASASPSAVKVNFNPPEITPATQLVAPQPAPAPATSGSEFKEGDLFTLKSNTKVHSFGTCWKKRQDNEGPDATSDEIYMIPSTTSSDGIYMIPSSTEVTVLANVQLEFVAYVSPSGVKIKPSVGFQHTISKIKHHDAFQSDRDVNTLHKVRVKAYNSGAQPAHA